MNRTISITCWLIVVLALLPLSCLLTIGFLLSGPNPETVLDNAQPVCERISVALEAYHHKHRRFPEKLADLVTQGFLAEIPKLPPYPNTSSSGPFYEANSALDFYRLQYWYYVEGGIGPGHPYRRFRISDDPKGWTTGGLRSFDDLVADRILVIYRKQRDAKSLEMFMTEVVAKGDCLSRKRVIDWLGPESEIQLPPLLSGTEKKGYVYQARDDEKKQYCLVYKNHWLPLLKSYLPADERARYPERKGAYDDASVDKNYPVLDQLLLIQRSDGQPTWTVLRKSPPSRFDKPSGRYEVVP